jgi:uncharacterized DUF497 family protein
MYTKYKQFEWDSIKARWNAIKHGIGFKKSATAFEDTLSVLATDETHSTNETRECLIGEASVGALVTFIFTRRQNAFRLMTARKSNGEEKTLYEKINPSTF